MPGVCTTCAAGWRKAGTACVKRTCSTAVPNRMWAGTVRPSALLPTVRTWAACCARCAADNQCQRFTVGAAGCSLYCATAGLALSAAPGYKAGSGELPGGQLHSCYVWPDVNGLQGGHPPVHAAGQHGGSAFPLPCMHLTHCRARLLAVV